jgi:hypothetical protein
MMAVEAVAEACGARLRGAARVLDAAGDGREGDEDAEGEGGCLGDGGG